MQIDLDKKARAVEDRIGAGCKCMIIGSTDFWGEDSEQICLEIGRALASITDLVLVTGGVEGVGESVGRTFFGRRLEMNIPPRVFHVLPEGEPSWDYGETIFAGSTMHERREMLGRLRGVFVAVEGGPGTAHEAEVALRTGNIVIPVGRSGGASADLFQRLSCQKAGFEGVWARLADRQAPIESVAQVVHELVAKLSCSEIEAERLDDKSLY
jgi:predicted Rossmann-fold nucleotide-binding protein